MNNSKFESYNNLSEIVAGENRERLSMKLDEYKSRIGNPKFDEKNNRYKISILQPLVETGRVNIEKVKAQLQEADGNDFDNYQFNDCAGVIKDYVLTGGKNLMGGTGLPERPQEENIEEGEIH